MGTPHNKKPPTEWRLRRVALGYSGAAIGRLAGFTTSKILRIERDPARARLGDVQRIDEALKRLAGQLATATKAAP